MILNSLDGVYCLTNESFDGSIPHLADGPVSVVATRDLVMISTFGQWVDVSIGVTVASGGGPLRMPGHGWEVEREITVELSGPVKVTDMEFDPHGGEALPAKPGTYLVQVFARSVEHVSERPFPQVDDVIMEQHMLYLSPAGYGGNK